MDNCAGDDGIIQLEDGWKFELTNECKVVASGCINYKAFNSGAAQYQISKNGKILKEGSVDICSNTEKLSDEEKALLTSWGVPDSCPVPEGRVCAEEATFDVSEYKNMLGFAKGKTEADLTIEHDNGKSCLKVVFQVNK